VAVARLLAKCRSSASISENDNMALAGIVSTQLWYEAFIHRFDATAVDERTDIVTVGASEPLAAAM
jgi:hypothetical protein